MFTINTQTEIIIEDSRIADFPAVIKGISRFHRDKGMALLPSGRKATHIRLKFQEDLGDEGWVIEASEKELDLCAGGELGALYGLIHISRTGLGIQPLWYWLDQEFERTEEKTFPEGRISSPGTAYRFRGWFINDEVLIDAWRPSENPEEAWEMAFEALLRLDGNIVIAGTDKNSGKYTDLASSMGLWITQHHSEPLGAEMFSRRYPDLQASYLSHPEHFLRLWREGIERLEGKKVLWTLGFRGQGDSPFWANDPQFDSDEKRGALLTSIIEQQMALVREKVENPLFAYNVYGEAVELYKGGFLKLPEQVIRVWGDNGYGKMVNRRRELENPRSSSLPPTSEIALPHGTYYHVSFYDLQAANHITLTPVPIDMLKRELEEAYKGGIDDLVIVNVSNIRPHGASASLLASFWQKGRLDVNEFLAGFGDCYFMAEPDKIASAFRLYGEASLNYGKEEDEKAGDQFYTYTLRAILCEWLKQNVTLSVPGMKWMNDEPFPQLTERIGRMAGEAEKSYARLLTSLEEISSEGEDRLFDSTLKMNARLYRSLAQTLIHFTESARLFLEEKFPEAFMKCGEAAEENDRASEMLRDWEKGKWTGFYGNDCLTDISQNSYLLRVLMEHIRAFGDGPHYWLWQRKYSYEKRDRNVVLITNWEKHKDAWSLYKAIRGQRET